MNEIKCPHCGEMFTIDEAGFAAILKQVRDAEFDKEVRRHEQLMASEKQQAVQLAVAEALAKAQGDAAQKEARIAELEARLQAEQRERESQQRLAHAERERALADAAAAKDVRIVELEQRVEAQGRAFEAEKKLAVEQARSALERERDALAAQVALKDAEKSRCESALKEQLAIELKAKDDIIAYKDGEIERYKDMKARLSTKMVGESLEQHCETEFNKIRAAAFPRAYFEKDNDASEGSKGDFIFRECDEEGNEIVSIMFEMKNESDDSSHRHKNEDFFKKLDADRRKKGCEYAVLVTLLEPESELYNQGIVDVRHSPAVLPADDLHPAQRGVELDGVQGGAGGGAQPEHRHHEIRRADGNVQKRFRAQLRSGQPQVPDGHRRDRQDHPALAEDQGRPRVVREQPAPGEQQGPRPHHQAPDQEQPHHESGLRGAGRGEG